MSSVLLNCHTVHCDTINIAELLYCPLWYHQHYWTGILPIVISSIVKMYYCTLWCHQYCWTVILSIVMSSIFLSCHIVHCDVINITELSHYPPSISLNCYIVHSDIINIAWLSNLPFAMSQILPNCHTAAHGDAINIVGLSLWFKVGQIKYTGTCGEWKCSCSRRCPNYIWVIKFSKWGIVIWSRW